MIGLSPIPAKATPATSGQAAPTGVAGGFVHLLSVFLDASAGTADAQADPASTGDRHALADDGKTLPDDTADDGTDGHDPALIWLPIALTQPPAPVARPILLSGGFGVNPAAEFPGGALETNAPLSPAVAGTQVADLTGSATLTAEPRAMLQIAASLTMKPTAQSGAAGDASGDTAIASSAGPVADTAPRPPARAASDASTLQRTDPAAAAPAARSAAEVFAGAMSAATHHARPADRADQNDIPSAIAGAQLDTANKPVVQAVSDTRHAPLDLRDDRGLQGMIDRIELLRDDANARDTRIRLMPDALGGVDVSVRKEGDIVHVHFTAETQATRTLLIDAQPRLAELAEARGVKLGQASVDAGTGNGAIPHPRPEASRPAPPAPAVAAEDDASIDQRLA